MGGWLGLLALAAAGATLVATIALSHGDSLAPAVESPRPAADDQATVASLEARMRAAPGDAEGWRSLAAAYFDAHRFADAAGAYAKAARLLPDRADIWSGLGEAQTMAANAIDQVAHDAFEKALELDPKNARARYFLAVEKDVRGDHQGAVDDWIALLRDGPRDSPWAQSVHELVIKVATQHKIDVKGRLPEVAPVPALAWGDDAARAAIPGPTSDQIADAARLNPSDQDAMARSMVARLAQRLAAQPGDFDGWVRLMRAQMVLRDSKAAGDALANARRAFAGDRPALDRLAAAARTLGVPGT